MLLSQDVAGNLRQRRAARPVRAGRAGDGLAEASLVA